MAALLYDPHCEWTIHYNLYTKKKRNPQNFIWKLILKKKKNKQTNKKNIKNENQMSAALRTTLF